MKTTNRDRAAAEIGASKLSGGRWIYSATETGSWWVIAGHQLATLCDYLDSADPDVAADAYSHWCGSHTGHEITRGEIEALSDEAAVAGDLVMVRLCREAMAQDADAIVKVAEALLDAQAQVAA